MVQDRDGSRRLVASRRSRRRPGARTGRRRPVEQGVPFDRSHRVPGLGLGARGIARDLPWCARPRPVRPGLQPPRRRSVRHRLSRGTGASPVDEDLLRLPGIALLEDDGGHGRHGYRSALSGVAATRRSLRVLPPCRRRHCLRRWGRGGTHTPRSSGPAFLPGSTSTSPSSASVASTAFPPNRSPISSTPPPTFVTHHSSRTGAHGPTRTVWCSNGAGLRRGRLRHPGRHGSTRHDRSRPQVGAMARDARARSKPSAHRACSCGCGGPRRSSDRPGRARP